MCQECVNQQARLQNQLKISSKEALSIMWEFTAFPFAYPDYTNPQVDEFLAEALVNSDALEGVPARA